MEYFRIVLILKDGAIKQGIREFPTGTDQQEAYFQTWRKAMQIYSDARIDSIKLERLHADHPHVLKFLQGKAELD